MIALPKALGAGHALGPRFFAFSTKSCYGRTAAYRRISPYTLRAHLRISAVANRRATSFLDREKLRGLSGLAIVQGGKPRLIHASAVLFQDQQRGEDIRDPPRQGKTQSERSQEDAASEDSSKTSSEDPGSRKDDSGAEQEQTKDESKEDSLPPPPPPHGDKTPWQVFTETLRSEFQASKEWNESTKALASSAHQFTENESVKRARAAYTAASDAATSTTSSALRNTGKALGKGAAWTWDTPVVKGVRIGVSATGKAIEKGTRPVRETEAFKKAVGGVKEVIDDGSSSKYGGWAEKEERRRRRELRELNEAKANGRPGRRPEKVEEDPESVLKPS